jgi:Uma2 family endonuclease
MATFPATRPITAADVERLDNDKVVEVLKGSWVEKPMVGELHSAIEVRLIVMLDGFVRPNKLGRVYTSDTTFVLEGTPGDIKTMRLPDVSFVSAGRVKETDRGSFYYQSPDLAIEIVSPSERTSDTQAKINDYLRTGSREVWIVYPETRQVSVLLPDGTATIYGAGQKISGGDLLPGLSLSVDEVFDV